MYRYRLAWWGVAIAGCGLAFGGAPQYAVGATQGPAAGTQTSSPARQQGTAKKGPGAQSYSNNCAVCHGLPGQEQTAIAKGEFPKPPELFQGKGVTDDPVGDTYWVVANGIRLTGMPGFTGSLSSDQMWQVSLLLANADKLSPGVKTALQAPLAQ